MAAQAAAIAGESSFPQMTPRLPTVAEAVALRDTCDALRNAVIVAARLSPYKLGPPPPTTITFPTSAGVNGLEVPQESVAEPKVSAPSVTAFPFPCAPNHLTETWLDAR